MKKTMLFVLVALMVILACSCRPSTTGTNDNVALKVSEFADSLYNTMQEAFSSLPSASGKAPICKAEGRDLIVIYEHDSSVSMTAEEWEEHARGDDIIHYPYYKDLMKYVGDGAEDVRLVIKYVDAEGKTMITHVIDKEYTPSSTSGIEVINPTEADIEELKSKLERYCSDNQSRLETEYGEVFDGASGTSCYVEGLCLVLEYRYTSDISKQHFFEIIEEIAVNFNPLAVDLMAATGNMPVGLIIRCFDSDGEKLLDYPIGGTSPIVELNGE